MFVDVRIPVRTDFVPRRARNVRKGYAFETMSFSVREISVAEAPPVLSAGMVGTMRIVRGFDGLLWAPPPSVTVRGIDPATTAASIIGSRASATGLGPDTSRLQHPMEADATPVSSQRDFVRSVMQRWLDEEVVVVDGELHQRTASPIAAGTSIVEDASDKASLVVRHDDRQTPAWFPSGDTRTADPSFSVLDPTLHREASLDPRNVDQNQLAFGVKRRFMEERAKAGATTKAWKSVGCLAHLLPAMARAEAEAGTPLAEIEDVLSVVAGSAGRAHVPTHSDDERRGRLVSLTLSDKEQPVLSTACPWGFRRLHPDQDWLLFSAADRWKAEEIARPLAKRTWTPVPAEDMDEDLEFDIDSWNLTVAMEHVLSRTDERIGYLRKSDLDALARIAVHVRDWRADAASVRSPERRDTFVRDAATIVAMLDDPVFQDVGEEWMRGIAGSSCAAALARPQETAFVDDDAEMAGFSF